MPKISKIKGNIVTLSGKYNYEQEQYFQLSKNTKGVVLLAKEDEAKLLVIGNLSEIEVNKEATVLKDQSIVSADENWLGKIIDPFGNIIHDDSTTKNKTKIIGKQFMYKNSPTIVERVKLNRPLDTGIISIDAINPIGLGQRQLIIGDRSSGKTSIASSIIINQKNSDIICIYVAIGQKRSSVISFYERLKKHDAHKNTMIIFSSPDSPACQLLAPSIGMTIAEIFAYKGKDVLIVLDDLTKHANIYREISLCIGKNPGREAYPTDIFYRHSFLLERAGQFIDNNEYNGGSITALPIIETVQEDVASLIPSNVISITDGQIFTSVEKYNNGLFPAIDLKLSVSRTGSSVQSKQIKNFSKGLKAEYSKLLEVNKFAEISVDLSKDIKDKLRQWSGINNLFTQYGYLGYTRNEMSLIIELYRNGMLSGISNFKHFNTIFKNYINFSKGAMRIKDKISKNKDVTKEEYEIVFAPLRDAMRGKFGGVITSRDLLKLKEVQ